MPNIDKIFTDMTKDELLEQFMKLDIETDYIQEKIDEFIEEYDAKMEQIEEIDNLLNTMDITETKESSNN